MYIIYIFLGFINVHSQEIQSVSFYGNSRSSTSMIQREIRTRPGASFSSKTLHEDRAWLLREGMFNRVELEMIPGTLDSLIRVLVILQEKSIMSIMPLLRRDSRFGISAGMEIVIHNAWGKRQRIKAFSQIGGEPGAGISWSMPHSSAPFQMNWQAMINHYRTPYLYPDAKEKFNYRKTNIHVAASRPIHRHWTTGLAAGLIHHQAEIGEQTLSGSTEEYAYYYEASSCIDTRDWPAYPQSGIMLEISARRYQAAQEQSLIQTRLHGSYYHTVLNNNILAIETHIRWFNNHAPTLYKWHLGGGSTIRGLKTGDLAGDNAINATLEYRIPILYSRHPLEGFHAGYALVLFIDTGSAWNKGTNIANRRWETAGGMGIHAIWGQYVLRTEYGYHGRGWGFLSAGTSIKF
ncbi:BamA/TamA family outer membrane protein [bacterium]|nr:BamA/TamA family outer membrane protein [bacterium]